MAIYQIIVLILSVLFISSSVFYYRRGEASLFELVLWLLFWITISLLAIMPDTLTNLLADIFGFKSNVTALIFTSFGVLFYINFRNMFTINKLKRKLTEVIRKQALKDAED